MRGPRWRPSAASNLARSPPEKWPWTWGIRPWGWDGRGWPEQWRCGEPAVVFSFFHKRAVDAKLKRCRFHAPRRLSSPPPPRSPRKGQGEGPRPCLWRGCEGGRVRSGGGGACRGQRQSPHARFFSRSKIAVDDSFEKMGSRSPAACAAAPPAALCRPPLPVIARSHTHTHTRAPSPSPLSARPRRRPGPGRLRRRGQEHHLLQIHRQAGRPRDALQQDRRGQGRGVGDGGLEAEQDRPHGERRERRDPGRGAGQRLEKFSTPSSPPQKKNTPCPSPLLSSHRSTPPAPHTHTQADKVFEYKNKTDKALK